ncbi:serine/arginine repetitive matrix protein 1 [Marchantia polymorpha subsp. ruderalis]
MQVTSITKLLMKNPLDDFANLCAKLFSPHRLVLRRPKPWIAGSFSGSNDLLHRSTLFILVRNCKRGSLKLKQIPLVPTCHLALSLRWILGMERSSVQTIRLDIAARRARIAASLRASHASNANEEATSKMNNENGNKVLAKTQELAANALKTHLKDNILLLRNLANDRAFNYIKSKWTSSENVDHLRKEGKSETTTWVLDHKDTISVDYADPHHIYDKIFNLLQENEVILDGRWKMIELMKAELSCKDDEYNISINYQQREVHALFTLMTYQGLRLREFYTQNLLDVEKMFLDRRASLLISNKSNMGRILQNRQDREDTYHDEVHSCKDNFIKVLDSIRENDVEEYNLLKLKLEGDSQSLEEHLQVMQAMYQLNAEKLDYNLLVLTEREYENYVMTNQQKKKLTRQRDTLSTIKGRHRELERSFMGHNERLADDHNRVTKLLQDLQMKEQSLQASHANIKKRFFLMHQRMISGVVNRILQADKEIHEEELGWIWRSPCKTIPHRLGPQPPRIDYEPDQPIALKENDQFQKLLDCFSSERYHSFLLTLIKEASFLIDKEYQDYFKEVEPKLQFQVWSASILNALGVGNTHALEKLYIFITNRMDADDGVNILKLKSFIQGETFFEIFSAEDDDHNSLTHVISKSRACSDKLQRDSKENSEKLNWDGYWSSFTTSISPKVMRVYKHLNLALLSYNQMLKDSSRRRIRV